MKSEELLAAFRNALERGQSVEQAKQSLTNSGYDSKAIEQAAQMASQGASPYVDSSESKPGQPAQPGQAAPKPDKKSNTGTIILIVFLLLIIGSAIGFGILFWDDIRPFIARFLS